MSTRRDTGFSLVELLLAMTLSLVILGATLTVFASAERGHRDNQRQNEAQDQVRFATDTLARRLRNLASPTDAGTTPEQPIERANAQDLIFRTVNSAGAADPANPQNLQRYRYCLAPDKPLLYVQRQTWSATADPGMPPGTDCPASGWSETSVAASSVTNGARAVFSYERNAIGSFSEQPDVAEADFPTVVAIGTRLFVDPLAAQSAQGVDAHNAGLPPQPEPGAAGQLHRHAHYRNQRPAQRHGLRRPRGSTALIRLVCGRREACQHVRDAECDPHRGVTFRLRGGHRCRQPVDPVDPPQNHMHLIHLHPLHSMISSRMRLEHGYVVVTALMLTLLMLTIGLAAFAFVDTQQKQSARERERESRLNLTEGVLSSQIFVLSRSWPESALSAYPFSCTEPPAARRPTRGVRMPLR